MQGKVVYYDSFREIGMIHGEGKYDDIFFDCKDVEGNEVLTEGDQVKFSLESKGIMAGKMALRIKRLKKIEKRKNNPQGMVERKKEVSQCDKLF